MRDIFLSILHSILHSFNPTLVRLRAVPAGTVAAGRTGFNPTLVRLRAKADATIATTRTPFQSHAGSI
ncbi:MAG: hypothetical protein NZ572_08275, partial [Thermoflexus sp.]|nr:hypothetical protein [Thermoflexus sp.]